MKITITGPRSVGKSTVSKIVAQKMGMEYISSDQIGEDAFKAHGGLDKAIKSGKVEESIKNGGYTIIIDVYDKKDNFIFDLSGGAFGSSKTLAEASLKVRTKAKEKSIIIGLLPSKDEQESVKILFEREKERPHFKEMDKNELFEKTKSSYSKFPALFEQFANFTVYTKDKKPESIALEIVGFIYSNLKVFST